MDKITSEYLLSFIGQDYGLMFSMDTIMLSLFGEVLLKESVNAGLVIRYSQMSFRPES